jgi:cytochrome P450
MPTLPPGPKGLFPFGNLLQLGSDWIGFCTQCVRRYGDTVFLRFFHIPICLVANPEAIENVLVTNHANFVKSRDYRAMESMMGKGLLTSDGELWKKQRKLIQPAFNHDDILGYARIMVDRTQEMLATWRDGETRDIHQEMMRLTLQIAAQTLFGADVSSYAETVAASVKVAMETFSLHASLALLVPLSWNPPQTPGLRRAVRNLDQVTSEIIARRRASGKKESDLLQMLLDTRDSDGSPMTEQQMRDELRTLLLAGHETTAAAMSWTWYLLAQNPEIEARLQRELQSVLGGRPPRADDLRHLSYTGMVIKESMRLYPPAWSVGRRARRPFVLNGYRLPADMYIFISQWITQRDPRLFADPERFDPERWQVDPIRNGTLPRFAYFPFGAGPRVCIGAGFAMMEATLLLAAIAQKFTMSLVPGHPVEPLASVTLRPKHGIRVVLRERAQQIRAEPIMEPRAS